MSRQHINRREFLKRSLGAGAYACCAAGLGPLTSNLVYAQSLAGNGSTLVLFNLFGGCDALNSFAVPYGRDQYYVRRGNIVVPRPDAGAGAVLPLNNDIGLHPNLVAVKSLYDLDEAAIIQGCGDPLNTQSHFTAQKNMSRGILSAQSADTRGWIGRLGDLYFQDVPFNTIAIGVANLPDFSAQRERHRPLVTPKLSTYRISNDVVQNPSGVNFAYDNEFRREIAAGMLRAPKAGLPSNQSLARQLAVGFRDSVPNIESASTQSVGSYPDTTAGRFFADASRVVRSGLGTKVIYGGLGGFDFHSDQLQRETNLLSELNAALSAFSTDLRGAGHWNNVTVCVFTEFGRKTIPNGSAGTDHGWGGAMLLAGGKVNGGIYGDTPSNTDLSHSRNFIVASLDFRRIFSELVVSLGLNAEPVFPEQFDRSPLGLFRA